MTMQEVNIARLKQLMVDKGWTFEDIALICGKDPKTIRSILYKGNRFPEYLVLALEIHETSKHRLEGWQQEAERQKDFNTSAILERVFNLLILKP